MNLERAQQKGDSKLEAMDITKYHHAIRTFVDAELAAGASFSDIATFAERTTARAVLGKEVDRSPAVSTSNGPEKEEFDRMCSIIGNKYTKMDWRLLTDAYFQEALEARRAFDGKTEAA